jgi:hypothetical protein
VVVGCWWGGRDLTVFLTLFLFVGFFFLAFHRFCQPHEELSFMQLQKRALRLDKILLGYQGHLGNEETVVNPKDKYTIKTWDAIGKWHQWCGRRGVGCDVLVLFWFG